MLELAKNFMITKKGKKIVNFSLFTSLFSLLIVAGYLLAFEGELLWKVQELNLFLDTPLFLKQQMVTSGWLLTWLGCYFTEFLYHPWLGVTLLVAWWVVMLLVMARTFRVPVQWTVVLLIPLAAIVIMNVDLGYWIYYLKLRGHFFVATIGTTLAVASVWGFRKLSIVRSALPLGSSKNCQLSIVNCQLSIAYLFLSPAVLYPLIGFYGLLATALMAVLWLGSKERTVSSRLFVLGVALLSIIFWPLFYYNYVFCQTGIQNIWWTGLPLFVMDEEKSLYYLPYVVLVASLLFLAVMCGRWKESGVKSQKSGVMFLCVQVAVLAVVGFSVYHFWYKDYNFHKELRMQQCVERCDWLGVLDEAAEADDEPTRAIVLMRNLALFRLGRQGNEMYHYLTGAKAPNAPIPVSTMQVAGRAIYYNYGLVNYSHRWCLEEGVEYGFRADHLKRLMLCALVDGDDQEARKYAGLLKHTRYHGEWVAKYERFIGHHDQLTADPEFEPICRLMKSGDVLGSDQMLVEKFLMTQFVNGKSDDPLFKEQALLSALWMKDIQAFWPRFFDYAQSHPDVHMPTHFQEAAYLYGHLEKGVDISVMPFDDQVKRDYDGFMALAQQCAGMSEEQMRPVFYPHFGHTFYYEYYLVRNQKLY